MKQIHNNKSLNLYPQPPHIRDPKYLDKNGKRKEVFKIDQMEKNGIRKVFRILTIPTFPIVGVNKIWKDSEEEKIHKKTNS